MSLDLGDLSMNQQNESPGGRTDRDTDCFCERGVRVCPAATGAGALLRAEDRTLSALRADGDDAGDHLFRLVASACNAMVRPYL